MKKTLNAELAVVEPQALTNESFVRLDDKHQVSVGPRGRVVQYLRDSITNGDLQAGQILPSAQKISDSLNVNRRTVYAALDILDDEGFIRSNGAKFRIVNPLKSSPSSLMNDTIVVFTHFPKNTPDSPVERGSLSEITHSIYENALSADKHILTLAHAEMKNKDAAFLLGQDRPAGVIFADGVDHATQFLQWGQQLRDNGVPVVLFGEEEVMREFDHVESDHFEGAYGLMKFLLGKGIKNPLCLWSSPLAKSSVLHASWQQKRLNGIAQALREVNRPVAPLKTWPLRDNAWKVDAGEFEREVRTVMGYLFEHFQGENPVDCLLAQTDLEFYLLAAACRGLGREPNRDVLIAGYDNMWEAQPMRAFESAIPVATVDKRNQQIGKSLVEMLLERIHERLPTSPQRRTVAPQLIPFI